MWTENSNSFRCVWRLLMAPQMKRYTVSYLFSKLLWAMKWLILLTVFIIAVFGGDLHTNEGNAEAARAFNAALLEMWQDGTYDNIYRSWYGETPERFSDCVENSASLYYPIMDDIDKDGLLDYTIKNLNIKMGYYGPLAIPPGFVVDNGAVTGGFYPDLAEEIMARIATNYGLGPIHIDWVVINGITNFYSDHVNGVYDVIFMSLFKTAMWSNPVAPRDEIWQFSCGLLTTEPIRYYVCPSAVNKNLDLTSYSTLDGPNTNVEYIGGGAQEAAALSKFPNSNTSAVSNLSTLFSDCENGVADVIVELPARITSSVDAFVVDSQPIATYQNTGAAFRLDS